MDIRAVDLASTEQICSCLKEFGISIQAADLEKIAGIKGTKNQLIQLNSNTFFINLQEKPFAAKILLNDNICLLQQDHRSLQRAYEWQEKQLAKTPYDVLALMGFEVFDQLEKLMEELEVAIEALEEKILESPRKPQLAQVIKFHRKAIFLKKRINQCLVIFIRCKQANALWDELILRGQSELDNARQTIELIENLREAYQASVDNKLNDTMKLLTVLATILLPINLLSSFFGMNFEGMPLIHTTYGVTVFYVISAIIAGSSYIYFKKKEWL